MGSSEPVGEEAAGAVTPAVCEKREGCRLPISGIGLVIICDNGGRTLDEAIDSVFAQTRPPDEIVVVDAGSDDLQTRQTLAGLERPRTRVFRVSSPGMPASADFGLRQTIAPYVVLLDAEDRLKPTYFEEAADLLDRRSALMFVTCGVQFENAPLLTRYGEPPTVSAVLMGDAMHWSTMFRRQMWETLGGFAGREAGIEDLDFFLTALERGFQVNHWRSPC